MLGSLFIVAAPSGAGKTSLVNALVEQQDNTALSISHTTRKARDGEVADKDYFFVSPRVFSNMRERGDFLESATVYDHSYGTSSEAVFEQLMNMHSEKHICKQKFDNITPSQDPKQEGNLNNIK